MKILFLDVDGVVNCKFTHQRHRGFIGIDPYMAFLVGRILDQTDAKMVLSSSWRLSEPGRKEVWQQVAPFFDVTPHLLGKSRGEEIEAWLAKHPEVKNYAILDDDGDMLPGQKLFQTSFKVGLTDAIAEEVIHYLGREESGVKLKQ